MCQLLGMNGNVPTDVCFSFTGFRRRGGGTDVHADGWGIAFREGPGWRLFRDPAPAAQSATAEQIGRVPIRSTHVIAHLRKATQGPVGLANTHPFLGELWGRRWTFAHNGHLEGYAPALRSRRPRGDTDSERAFCALLDGLAESFPAAMPSTAQVAERLAERTREIAAHGAFNYLLSDGETLFAHCTDRLCAIVREAPFGTAHLVDEDVAIDFRPLTRPSDRVAVLATTPLTDDEPWTAFAPGELAAFRDGARLAIG